MKVKGQLKEAQLEVLSEDPESQPVGRFWLNKTTNKVKTIVGGAVVNILTATDLITTALIGDSQVTRAKIANTAIDSAKIEDGAVTAVKLAIDSVITAKILNGNVTTEKIADGAITYAKLAAVNMALSDSTGNHSNSTVGPSPIVGNVSITTTGRPVLVLLVSDGSGNGAYIGSESGTSGYTNTNFIVSRGLTTVGRFPLSMTANGTVSQISSAPGAICLIDTPTAGTYTYNITAQVSANTTGRIMYCKLLALEL